MTSDTDPFKTLLENLGEGVCMVDGDGRIVLANRRFGELLDLPPDLIRPGLPFGRLAEHLGSGGDRGWSEVHRRIGSWRPETGPLCCESSLPGGRIVEARCKPVPAGGFVLTLGDITEEREAADRLRQGEERFRDFAEVASDFQWETDDELRITILSDNYARTPPRDLSEILGRPVWEVPGISDPDGENWRELRATLAARRPVADFRYSIVSKENRRLFRRLSGRPARDSAGRFTGYRFATRDETAEVEARQRARAAEDLLHRAIESIPEGFAVYDPEDRLTLMNRRYVVSAPTVLSYDPAEDAWLQPGLSFETVIRTGVERGNYPEAAGREEAFVQERLAAHREGKGHPFFVRTAAGRCAQVRDHRLPDGGTVVVRTDVTELMDREQALQAYQAHLDLALRAAKAAYWELDPVSGRHKLMPTYYANLGFADAPRDRSAWLDLLYPGDAARIDEAQRVARFDHSDHRYEFRIRSADGGWRWLSSSFRAVAFDAEGQATRLLGIDIDITHLKEIELALQRERDRAQRYLDVAGVIITVLDDRHRIVMLNRKGCEILDVREEEILGLDWFDTFSPEAERAKHKAIYANFLAGHAGPAQDVDMTMVTRGGQIRLATWHDILLRDENGKVVGGLSSGEDVTERREAERRLDEFRSLLEASAQASPDGILVTDRMGRYLFWNKRLQEMWGLSDDFLQARRSRVGRPFERLRPFVGLLADPTAFLEELRRVYGEGRDPARRFAEVKLRDGRVLEQFAATVSMGEPAVTAVAWIYRDITQAKKRDDELAGSQRLAAIGELSGGMAHELNNLLMVIGGHIELIQQQGAATREILKLAATASDAVQRGADLIRRVLAFARQQPLTPRLTDLNQLIAETLEPLLQLLGGRITLEFKKGEGLWKCVVDPGQLQTAIMNLALNARDAMPKGGRLTIETSNLTLGPTEAEAQGDLGPGDYVAIAVSDKGAGMTPAVARRAFEPFFTTKPVGQGTGLGLSMVFGFVKQSGGHVALDSAVGRGTTVRVLLPRCQQEAIVAPAPDGPAPRSADETVLVVEDEPGVGAIAEAFLVSIGYKVLRATDGPQALRILSGGQPVNILFTDLVLPAGMNGQQIAEAARQQNPRIRVLFASGYPMDALMSKGQIEPGAILLQKPYRRSELVEALRRLSA